ncbi:hypothetical protein GCM10009117_15440 [Gangjinia marincola]|uniref:Uncharacterized protein n=1 Tax=Gangjinia marincola TaxID=578463 RepID=A0ABN1MH21_9FLAO
MTTSLINILSAKEKRQFNLFLNAQNKRKDAKNIQLFELLQREQDERLDVVLYGKPSANAYHALHKRLKDNLIDFIAQKSLSQEASSKYKALRYLTAAREAYLREEPKTGQKLLQKTIEFSRPLEFFSIIQEALHTHIQYAHLHHDIHLEQLFDAFKHNQKKLEQQERVNMACAFLKHEIKQATLQKMISYRSLLEVTLTKFNLAGTTDLSFKSLYQLLDIIHTAANLEYAFAEALPYLNRLYYQVERVANHPKQHQLYRLAIDYFLANAHLRNLNFEACAEVLKRYETHLQQERLNPTSGAYQNFVLIKSLHLNFTGNHTEALKLITPHELDRSIHNPDLILVVCTIYIQQAEFKTAFKAFHLLKHTNSWYLKKYDREWVIKKDLIELILQVELDHFELAHSLLRRFLRTYKKTLEQNDLLRTFISLIQQMNHHPELLQEDRFKHKVKTGFSNYNTQTADLILISFYGWLMAKSQQTSIYETTLSLIKNLK